MKTCPKCGNVIQNDNARFCKECGTDLYGKNDGGIWLGDVSGQSDSNTSPKKRKKNDRPIAKFAIIGAAVIALLLVFVFAFSGSDNGENGTSLSVEPVVEQSEENNVYSTSESVNKQTQRETSVVTTERIAEPQNNASKQKEEEKTEDSQQKRLSTALAKGDYKQVQLLANEGYAPAYVPLAKYYLNNNEYDDADRYAKKGKATGQSGAQAIIKTLENLGYYD